MLMHEEFVLDFVKDKNDPFSDIIIESILYVAKKLSISSSSSSNGSDPQIEKDDDIVNQQRFMIRCLLLQQTFLFENYQLMYFHLQPSSLWHHKNVCFFKDTKYLYHFQSCKNSNITFDIHYSYSLAHVDKTYAAPEISTLTSLPAFRLPLIACFAFSLGKVLTQHHPLFTPYDKAWFLKQHPQAYFFLFGRCLEPDPRLRVPLYF